MAYDRQARGDRGAYERYLRGMESSMKQKVALTAAHLLAQGKVADMGMGSGGGSLALASLYPSLEVVGVDVNPTMVELAREKHRLPNLSFICGDIAAQCFPAASLDGIFDSSVLHHVTTFTDYDHAAAERALQVQAGQLKEHGMLIVRDFVDPGEGEVLLDLPAGDGDDSDDPARCSTARLFQRFAREFRKLSAAPGFKWEEAAAPGAGLRRFRVPRKIAAEFILRKDYRADWDTEILEEYTYFTQRRFEEIYARMNLRIVASLPLWNPWIVRNRYEGRVTLRHENGAPVEYPPTNYLIAGEKVGEGEGVRFEARPNAPSPSFLAMAHYRDRRTGALRDLVRRPYPTIDFVPWFAFQDEIFVIGRKSYPRPILACDARSTLDGSTPAQYVTEPLSVLQQDKPFGATVAESLQSHAGLAPGSIRRFAPGCVYYPSPGGIEEQVRSALVEVEPTFLQVSIEGVSGFSTSGHVRAIEATQLLRAAQVGGMSDARLEINTYQLLAALGRDPGPWIGDALKLSAESAFERADLPALLRREARRVFAEAAGAPAGFLELRSARFAELSGSGREVASRILEYVVPRSLSLNTVAVALLSRSRGEILIGVDDDDLPAVQSFEGNSGLLVAPAWRLPATVGGRRAARQWVEERLRLEYGLRPAGWWELGGKYHPSPGLTPERVHPYAVEVDAQAPAGKRPLTWVSLAEAIGHADRLHDGHLRIVLFRAAHALGLLAAPA